MKYTNAIAAVLVALLTACAAPSTAPTFSQTPLATPKEGMAVLYLYREYAEPTAFKPTLAIDGKEVVALPQQGFTWVYVTPGNHKLTSRWPFLAGAHGVEFSAEYVAGTRYFYEITGSSRLVGMSAAGMNFRTTAQMESQQEREALQRLEKCCRFISPELSSF